MNKPTTARDRGAVAFALVFPSVVTLFYFVFMAERSSGIQQTIYWLGKSLQFAFPLAWVLYAQGRRIEVVRPTRAGLTPGVVFGLAVVAGMFALYLTVLKPQGFFDGPAQRILAKVQDFGVGSLGTFLALGCFYALVHSFLEEYYWRWFVFGQLRMQGRLFSALAISSLGFMAHHVIVLGYYFGWTSPLTYLFSCSVAVGGLVWAALYHQTNSLYPPWVSHLLVDAGIFLLGYDVIRAGL